MLFEFEPFGVDAASEPSSAAAASAVHPQESQAPAAPGDAEAPASAGVEPVAVSEGVPDSLSKGNIPAPEDKTPAPEDNTSVPQDNATARDDNTGSPEDAAAGEDSALPSAEELNQLMDQYGSPQQAPSEGEILEGRVIAVSDLGVVVDIGGKFEGLIPAQEFLDADSPVKLEPGLTIEVQPTGEHKDGYAILSYQRAHRRRVWANIEKAYREKTHVNGRIVDRVKGGLVVDIGVRAFLPASQADLRPVHDLEEWKNQEIEVRVLKMNRKRGNVVVSRRAVLDEESQAQREKLKESLQEGQVLRGSVKSITSYGVFVDLGGMDGLLHVSDLSWGRVSNPVDVVRPGEELEVVVLKFDREKMRVSLGRRQLLPDPWATVAERFPAGSRVQGRVVGVADYGVFVELDAGVEGLVHVSEMSWSKRKQHPSKLVQVGDAVEVVVLEVKPEQRRISLGLKQAQPDPWTELAQKYPVGSKVTGRVRNLTEFGAFLEIEEGFDGLIHVSDISWTGRLKDAGEVFKKGDTVEAKVLKIDAVNRRVSLGVKQLNDIWANWFAAHKINDMVRGKVSRLTTFGAFVELADGVEGLCHISEIEERRSRDKQAPPPQKGSAAVLAPGREYDFKIVKINPDQHKIGLSYRAAVRQSERREVEEYRSSRSSSTATIGDAILAKRTL
jgi:small subunit ribosomal protein S1